VSIPRTGTIDRAGVRKLDELVMTLRLADACVSMRLCRCPPANADDVRAAQLRLRASIAELRSIGEAP
jgi:hypothetical protein